MLKRCELRGFSLMEVLVSLGIMAIALLALVTVLVTGLRAEDNSTQRKAGQDVAERVLGRTLGKLKQLSEAENNDFWNREHSAPSDPWLAGVEKRDGYDYHYKIFSSTVVNKSTGQPFGEAHGYEFNRLKKVDVVVSWSAGPGRAEDDLSRVSISRLVNRGGRL